MFVQNVIKLSAAVHALSCAQAFFPNLAMVQNPKIRSCDLDLSPMTLKFSRSCAVVKQNFIELSAEKKTQTKNNTVHRYRADSKYRSEPLDRGYLMTPIKRDSERMKKKQARYFDKPAYVQ